MKHKLLLFCAQALALASTYAESPTPDSPSQKSDKAELKLSYDSLKQLIDDLQTKKPVEKQAPPVAATIRSASYQFDLTSKKSAKVIATFAITTFADGWVSLPLLSTRYAVEKIEPASTVLSPDNGQLALLTKGAAEHQITVTFLIAAEPDNSFALDLIPSVSSQLRTSTLTGYDIQGAEASTEGVHILPVQGGIVRITPTRKAMTRASSWTADSRVLHIAMDNELQAQARIQLNAKQGDTATTANMILPKNSRIIEVTGPDLVGWKDSSQESEPSLQLTWETQGISRRRVTVIYTLPLLDPEETWSLSIPHLKEAGKTRGLLALVTPDEFQLTPNEAIPSLDSSLAPAWMKTHGLPLILKLPKAREVQFTGKRRAQIQAATATIKTAHFKTQIVTDGSTLSEGEISIIHRDPKPWVFKLPEGSRILTCRVDGVPANPIVRNDGALQLSLSAKQQSKEASTKIQLSFTSKFEKMQPIEGKLSLVLPSTPLFIHELHWQILLPSPFEATALDGNLSFSPNNNSGQSITLVKRLCRNQAAQTDIFYRKNSQ